MMRIRGIKRKLAWLAIIVAVSAVVAATFYGRSTLGDDATIKVLWRADVFARKVKGYVPELSWNELLQIDSPARWVWFGGHGS